MTRAPRTSTTAVGLLIGAVAGFAVGATLLPEGDASRDTFPEAELLPALDAEQCAGSVARWAGRLGVEGTGQLSAGRCEVNDGQGFLRLSVATEVANGTYPSARVQGTRTWYLTCATLAGGDERVQIPLAATTDPDVCGSPLATESGLSEFVVRADERVITVTIADGAGAPPREELAAVLREIGETW